jgi:hypothetical protein
MMAVAPSTSLAVGALVVGILAIPGACCCYSSVPLGIAAILMGVVSLNRAKAMPHLHGGRGLAIAGVVCGAIGLALTMSIILMGVGAQLMNGVQHRMGF